MEEAPFAGKDHGHPGIVGGADRFRVADGSAGMSDRANPRLSRDLDRVGEWKERVGTERGAADIMTRALRLLERESHGVDARGLPRADPERASATRNHDRVRDNV